MKCEIYLSTFSECGVRGSKMYNCRFVKNRIDLLSLVNVEMVKNCLQKHNIESLFLNKATLESSIFLIQN